MIIAKLQNRSCTEHAKIYSKAKKAIIVHTKLQNVQQRFMNEPNKLQICTFTLVIVRKRKTNVRWDLWVCKQSVQWSTVRLVNTLRLHKQPCHVLRHLQRHTTNPQMREICHTHPQKCNNRHTGLGPNRLERLEEVSPMTGNRIMWSSIHVINAS